MPKKNKQDSVVLGPNDLRRWQDVTTYAQAIRRWMADNPTYHIDAVVPEQLPGMFSTGGYLIIFSYD